MTLAGISGIEHRAALQKRDRILSQILALSKERGFSTAEFERFDAYLSVNLGLEGPAYVDEMQRPRNYWPGLTALPVHDTNHFSWAVDLEARFDEIRAELIDCSKSLGLGAHPQDLADRGSWSVLYFFGPEKQVKEIRTLCPLVSKLIETIPGTGRAGNTYLSVLKPGTHIQQHYGPTNARLRCHFAIKVPKSARIRVGDLCYEWKEGKCLIFDDSFEHEVWNDSDGERVVLIIDFWHPDMTEVEVWALNAARRLSDGLRDFSPDSSAMRAILA